MSKLTPSTALTSSTVRSIRSPERIGKCLCRSVTSRSGRSCRRAHAGAPPPGRAPARSLVGMRRAHPVVLAGSRAARASRSRADVAAVAYGQRGAKRQASGGSIRSGGRPGIAVSRPSRMPSPSSCGSAPSSASVYGCSGLSKRSSVDACSTTWPGVHDDDVVRRLGDDAHVVRDDDHRHVVLVPEVVEQVEHRRLDGHVERGRRLVGDQELRVAGERDRDHHALAHPAREAVRVVVEPLGRARDPHLLEQLDRLLPRLRLRHVVVAPDRLGDLRPDRQRRVQRGHRILEDHRDLAAAHVLELLLGELREVLPVEHDRAGDDLRRRLRDQAHDRERGHGLPAAGLADDAERLAALDREADAVDRAHDALAGEEVRPQVVDLEQRHATSPSSSGRARRAGRRR